MAAKLLAGRFRSSHQLPAYPQANF